MRPRVVRVGQVVVVGTACLVLAVTGCGGGDEAAEPDTSSGTSAEPTSTTGGTDRTSTTSTTVPTTPTSHAPDTVEGQVEQAYLRSWEVTTEAFAEVDSAVLAEAFADQALEYRTQDVEDIRSDGVATRVLVEHAYLIASVSETRAVVNDIYVNHMRDYDPETGEWVEPDPNSQRGSSYLLELRDGKWLVIDINAI